MAEVTKIDNDNISVIANSSKAKILSIDTLLANKDKLELTLSTFDADALVRKNDLISKFDAQVTEIKDKKVAELANIVDLLQKAVAAGVVLP